MGKGVTFRNGTALFGAIIGLGVLGGAAIPGAAQTAKNDLLALPQEKPIRGMSYPSLSPDGRTLCFTYLGDLWTVGISGGTASRLTVHESIDMMPRWSPDGKFIAFSSLRSGNFDIFLVPSEGGEARQVTLDSSNDILYDWSPDGSKLLFSSLRDTRTGTLFSVDLHTRALKQLTHDVETLRYGTWSPDGKSIAYARAGEPWWRAWYRGSVAAHIVTQNLETGAVKTVFKTTGQQFWPLYAADGKTLYVTMIYGDANTPNIWKIPADGGRPVPVTKHSGDAVRWTQIARNGSLLTYLYNGDLYTVKPDGSDDRKISIIARTDDKVNNQERLTLTQEATESVLAPDGKNIALVLRGDIWLVPTAGGDAKRLTDNPANDNDIAWSPDSAKLTFISDRGNQPDVYTIDVKTKAVNRLTDDMAQESNPTYSPDGRMISFAKAGSQPGLYIVDSGGINKPRKLAEGNGSNNFGVGIAAFSWSPDSRWVAFARMDRFSNKDIFVVPAVGGVAVNITRYPGDNDLPQFTKDGKKLLFISDRVGGPGSDAPDTLYSVALESEDSLPADKDGNPRQIADRSKDVKIDFNDIRLRAKAIMPPLGQVTDYAISPDSQKVIVQFGNTIWSLSLASNQLQPLAGNEASSTLTFLPDGSRVFYLGANGSLRSIGVGGGPVAVVPFSANVLFDRRELYRQAFNEFYRKFGASFYDAAMHGVNWKSLRDKYEVLLAGVGTPEEFANLLSEMVGEVNSSHSEIGAASHFYGPQTATLGLTFDDSYTGPGLKVKSVMPHGPADKAASRILPGEIILSVDGTDAALNEMFYTSLYDKAGKTVELLVNNKPTKDGARTVKIKPITAAEWGSLAYDAEVAERRALVDKLSNGRLAYIHIQEMNGESLQKFEREVEGDALYKEGLILDIRGNGGGNTHDKILNILSRRVYGYTQPRDGIRQSQPERALAKPIVLLIDQHSYSDAEIFPSGFRALKLGPIVGVPTPGYVIGTYGAKLVDGTNIRLPSWGWYTADGRNMENLGIPPDIFVENTAEDVAAGRDRQVETAVKTALAALPTKPETAFTNDTTGVPVSANTNPNGGSSHVAPPPIRDSKGRRTGSAP